MTATLPPSAQKIQDAIRAKGFDFRVQVMPDSTRTAAEAAAAIGCTVAQICKSLVFRTRKTARPVLVIASGVNRVDEKVIRRALGEKLGKADADFVREHTGYSIGGVPPLGHASKLITFIDEDLLQYDQVWAAAGTPHAVFPLTPAALLEFTGGQVMAVRKG